MLTAVDRMLIDAATAQLGVLTEDPNHTVAAVAIDTTGRVHAGVNVHHFTGGPCAELVALGVAAAKAAGPIAEIVAVGDDGRGVLAPCGRCRQVLLDQHPDCLVVVPTPDGPDAVPIRTLLPYGYAFPDAKPERIVRFAGRYFDAVTSGRKTATTRHDDPISVGSAWLVFEDDGSLRRLRGEVLSTEPRTLTALTDEDARLEACDTADDLRDGLVGHYPGITDEAPLVFVRFRVLPA